jgi:two-component system CheB/CheR fusion protein
MTGPVYLAGSQFSRPGIEVRMRAISHVEAQIGKPAQAAQSPRTLRRLADKPAGGMPAKDPSQPVAADDGARPPTVLVIDDDMMRDYVRLLLELDGRTVDAYARPEAFLTAYRPGRNGCLVIDLHLPGMSGIELLERMAADQHRLPAIMITGRGDVKSAVQAMKVGAVDLIEKPFSPKELFASIDRALERLRISNEPSGWGEAKSQLGDGLTVQQREAMEQIIAVTAKRIAALTPRQRQIMDLIVCGYSNKEIAWRLGISRRTVENHRATVMERTGAKSLPDLIYLAMKSLPAESLSHRDMATRVELTARGSRPAISAHTDD